MATFKAGKTGRVQVNAINMATSEWSCTLTGAELDTSNFEGNGRHSYILGLEGMSWSISSLYDAAKNPLDDPPGLYARDDGTNMKLYVDRPNSRYWDLPTWICSSAATTVTVAGLVTFTASGKAQDDFALLTGSNP